MRIEYGAKSDQGMVRDSNEDFYITSDSYGTFIIADGMGGHAAGEIASRLASETVKAFIEKDHGGSKNDGRLKNAVQEANARVYEAQVQKPEFRGMGSTLTVLSISAARFHIAHVGDSRAYLYRAGNIDQLTQDHSVVWSLYENGILTKEDLSKHPQKNLITRSIGTNPQVEVDLHSDRICEGDIFLLCSDGLTDVLTDSDIARTLSSSVEHVQDFADLLVEAANKAGGPDNITVVVVRTGSDA